MSVLSQIAYPLFQAPIGSAASIELVAAVSNAGGAGSLAMTWTGAHCPRMFVMRHEPGLLLELRKEVLDGQ